MELRNKTFMLLALLAMFCMAMSAVIIACDDDDDDNDTVDDDFDDDNNDADDDNDDNDDADDDADDDDDDDDFTCEEVADGMINVCQLTLVDMEGNQVDELGLVDWCAMSESLFAAKTAAPFWDCLGDCALVEFCDEGCFDGCFDPPAPGTACGDTVDSVYGCSITWVFDNGLYWIPEMDMQSACEVLTDWPWDCYADCIPGGCDPMLDCLNACV